MIIQYDTRPDATIDDKIRSLVESVMLAFNEAGLSTDSKVSTESESSQESIKTVEAQIRQISGDVTSLDSRVTTLEGQQALPDAPAEDGAYVLTVTVTDGTPVYTWEVTGI